MGPTYRIKRDLNVKARIVMHPVLAQSLGIRISKTALLQFGLHRMKVTLLLTRKINSRTIRLSSDVIRTFRLPMTSRFELNYSGNKLQIGPYIGILAEATRVRLLKRKQALTGFTRSYGAIGGAIVAFTADQVDRKSRTIRGYMYNPIKNRWVPGWYAYPASIFNKTEASLSKQWRLVQSVSNHFHSILGRNLYNYPVFHKWDMYKWLQPIPTFLEHLPKTILYQQPMDILAMLNKYGRVFVKPIFGRSAKGIYEFSTRDDGYFIRSRINDRNQETFISHRASFESFIRKSIALEQYIVQQAIDLVTNQNRIVDFRLILVKDYSGEWKDMGLFSRFGALDSMVCNIDAGGIPGLGDAAIQTLFPFTEEEWSEYRQRLSILAITAAKCVENYLVNCGNLGIDFAIDNQKKIWILEMNNQNPEHYVAYMAGDQRTFFESRLANMLYAKKLTGF